MTGNISLPIRPSNAGLAAQQAAGATIIVTDVTMARVAHWPASQRLLYYCPSIAEIPICRPKAQSLGLGLALYQDQRGYDLSVWSQLRVGDVLCPQFYRQQHETDGQFDSFMRAEYAELSAGGHYPVLPVLGVHWRVAPGGVKTIGTYEIVCGVILASRAAHDQQWPGALIFRHFPPGAPSDVPDEVWPYLDRWGSGITSLWRPPAPIVPPVVPTDLLLLKGFPMTGPFCLSKSQLATIDGQTVAIIDVVDAGGGKGVFLTEPLPDCTKGGAPMPPGKAVLGVDPTGKIVGCPVDYRPLGGWQWGRVSGNAFIINGNYSFYLVS